MYSLHFEFLAFELAAAVVLGAPLSVPVALAIQLRNIWLDLPLIALAAAVGIQIQGHLAGVADDSGATWLSSLLWFLWPVPTAFGAAAALLVTWKETLSVVAIPLAAALVCVLWVQGENTIRKVAPARAAARSWSVLRVGMSAYTGGDSASGQIICPTLAAAIAMDSKHPPKCVTVRRAISLWMQ